MLTLGTKPTTEAGGPDTAPHAARRQPRPHQEADAYACPCGRRRPVGVVLGLRSGARPRLDGQWYCRKACLLAALQVRARRDFSEQPAAPVGVVRHRVPLGLILQARGIVTAAQLHEALRLQTATGHRLGDVLQGFFGVAEEQVTSAIAAQWGLPALYVQAGAALSADPYAPIRLFRASGSFPVEMSGSGLLLACADGPDPSIALALERMHGVPVKFGVVRSSVLEQWQSSQAEGGSRVSNIRCNDRAAMAEEAADLLHRLQPVDSRIVRAAGHWWLRLWLEEAAQQQNLASDASDVVDVLFSLAPSRSDASPTLPA